MQYRRSAKCVTADQSRCFLQDDPYLAPIFQQRLAAAFAWIEGDADECDETEGWIEEAEDRFEEDEANMAADEDGSLERKHKHKHKHHHKKKKRKEHPCDYLEGLSNSVVRYGTSPGHYTRETGGNNTCYEAVGRSLSCRLQQLTQFCPHKKLAPSAD